MNKTTPLIILLLTVTLNLASQESIKTLGNGDYQIISNETKKKVRELESYIKTMTDKSLQTSIKQIAVTNAVSIFSSEDNIVQVSSKNNSNIRTYKIRQYFNHIMVLNYSRIEIKWYDIDYYTDLHQGPDGKYYAVVTVFQKFQGFTNDGLIYSDTTQKNIEIVVDVNTDPKGHTFYKVAIGDISVLQTR